MARWKDGKKMGRWKGDGKKMARGWNENENCKDEGMNI